MKTFLLAATLCSTLMATAQTINVTNTEAGKLGPIAMPAVAVSGPLNKADLNKLDAIQGVTIKQLDLSGADVQEIPDSAFFTRCHLNDKGAPIWDNNEVFLSYVLPGTLTSIGKSSFYGTVATNVDFSACKQLTAVGEHAFDGAVVDAINLKDLTALKILDNYAFGQTHTATINLDGCAALDTICERAFYNSYFVTATSFKGLTSLKFIGNRAFLNLGKTSGDAGVIDLTECTALETIDESAFQSAKVTAVLFPASLKEIKAKAFNLASKITELTFLGTVPPTLGATAFTSAVMSGATVYVPAGSEEAYKAAGFENVTTATAVSAARLSDGDSSITYDLNGRQVSDAARGIVITNGRKIANK